MKEPTQEDLDAPLPEDVVSELASLEDQFQGRLWNMRTSYWNAIAGFQSGILAAASIVAVFNDAASDCLYGTVVFASIIGFASIAMCFKTMTSYYNRRIMPPGTLRTIASLLEHYKDQEEKSSDGQDYRKRRKVFERVAEGTAVIGAIGLFFLAVA